MSDGGASVGGGYHFLTVDNTTYLMPSGETDIKKAHGIINSGDALSIERFNRTGIITADLFKGPIQLYGIDENGQSTGNVKDSLTFTEIASGRGGLLAKKASVGDLIVLIMMCSLEAAKDSRKAIGESAIMKRSIAVEQTRFVFEESKHAAEEKKEAAELAAICGIVGSSIGVVAGVISMGMSMHAAGSYASAVKGAGGGHGVAGEATAEATQVDVQAANAKLQYQTQLAGQISQIGSALGGIVQNAGNLVAAKHQFRADIANANIEAVRAFVQELTAEISSSDSAYRDASQQISQIVELARQVLQQLQALKDSIMHNV
jgi:hypothetical protein